MLDVLFLTVQYALYTLIAMVAVGLVWAIVRAVLRQMGWGLVLAIRPVADARRYPADWERVRAVVLQRDGYACRNCGAGGALQVHHIVPLSAGGTNRWTNLTTLCRRCHRRLHPRMRDSL